jgi:antitoxin component YwqK of YwqJK toxin-antitoxin module
MKAKIKTKKYIKLCLLLFLIIGCSNISIAQKVKKTYYDWQSTKIKEIFTVNIHDQKNGNYKAYFENGLLGLDGTFKNGVIHGLCKEYYEYVGNNSSAGASRLLTVGNYVNGEKDGVFIIYDYIYEGRSYKDNGLDGDVNKHLKFGIQVKYGEFKYKLGQLISTIRYFPNGKISKVENFNNDVLAKEIIYKNDGSIVSEYNRTGPFKTYYDDGKPWVLANKTDDKFDGEYLMYNSKGIIIQKGIYKLEKNVGEWILPKTDNGSYPQTYNGTSTIDNPDHLRKCFFDDEGNVDKTKVSESFYLDGKKRDVCFVSKIDAYNEIIAPGEYTSYYPNGQMNEKGIIKQDCSVAPNWDTDMIGHWVSYYENGNLQEEGDYKDNKGDDPRIGTHWKYYKEDGTLDSEKTF